MPQRSRPHDDAPRFRPARCFVRQRTRSSSRLGRGLRFEPLEPRFLLAADFGDAPLPYPIASHEAIGPTLGALRDTEAASQPTAAADGDGPDDDGVTFGSLHVGQLAATVTVNVQNAPTGAKLDAWIDFNDDGNWGGPSEQIAFGCAVIEGDNIFTLSVPPSAKQGVTFARVRLSIAGGLAPGGSALDGEVEDLAVTIAPPALALGSLPDETVLAPSGGGWRIRAVDLDQDGDVDIVRNDGSAGLVWLENRGDEGFVGYPIASSGLIAANPTVVDLDRDGDLDILACGVNRAVWLENDGSQAFTERLILTSTARVWLAQAGDLDGDGDFDIAVSLGALSRAIVMENDGSQGFTTSAEIGLTDNRAIELADIDRDGDLDVVTVGRNTNSSGDVAWFRNNGNFSFTGFRVDTPISSAQSSGMIATAIADLDGDGDPDIIAAGNAGAAGAPVAWHEQKSDHTFTTHHLDSQGAESVVPADIDGDGDVDLLVGNIQRTLDLLENLGGGIFARRNLSSGTIYEAAAGDFDGDGALDVVAAPWNTGSQLVYFQNRRLLDPDYGDAPASYATDRAHSGPAHGAGGPQLGAMRDAEIDGQPTAEATGDGADDDGVAFSSLRVGSAATMTVNVQNAPQGARLSAWIDLDRDGNFGGAGEMVLAAAPVANGSNTLLFTLPASAAAGATFARVRIATDAVATFRGHAADGEVEDFAIALLPPSPATGNFASVHLVPYSLSTITAPAHSISTADIDGDGDVDVLTSNNQSTLKWHENLGNGAYLTHSLITSTGGPSGARPGDVDRDGDIDIVVVTSTGVLWLENTGAREFLYHAAAHPGSLRGVFELADFDGDGDLDVMAAQSTAPYPIAYLQNNGQGEFGAALPVVTTPVVSWVSGIHAADIDRDGDLDFAATFVNTTSSAGALAWYENQGMYFVERSLSSGATSPPFQDVTAIDFDADGDVDVVSLSSGSLPGAEWWENNGEQSFTKRTIGALPVSFATGIPIAADRLQIGDVDGDGDLDVVAGVQGRGYWFFRREMLATFTAVQFADAGLPGSSTPVALGDVDGDGTLEVFATGSPDTSFLWIQSTPFGDYDRNGVVNQADRDLYDQTLGQPAVPPGAEADGDRSGVVDAADLAIWEANVGKKTLPQIGPADYDLNERIDGLDFLSWQRRLGTTYASSGNVNDPDKSGATDAGDLALWRPQFGQGRGTANGLGHETRVATPAAQPLATPAAAGSSEPAIAASVVIAIDQSAIARPRAIFAPRPRNGFVASTHFVRDSALATLRLPVTQASATVNRDHELSSRNDPDKSFTAAIDAALGDAF